MLSDREEALDIAQEVFLSAYRNLDRFREEASLSTWLLKIAANRSLNRIRQRSSRAAREVTYPESALRDDLPFQPLAPEEGRPDRIAEIREMGKILEHAPPPNRRRFALADAPFGRRGVHVRGSRRHGGDPGGNREIKASQGADGVEENPRSGGMRDAGMDCERVQDSLSEFLEGSLPEIEQAGVTAHLAECLPCKAVKEGLEETLLLLRSLPPRQAPPDLLEGIRRRLRKRKRPRGL
jgi:RNA polymerase sigma factor (sigma-70 family)